MDKSEMCYACKCEFKNIGEKNFAQRYLPPFSQLECESMWILYFDIPIYEIE